VAADRTRTLQLSRLPGGEPEIFASIQGEGVTCGVPSVFVRLALCNLGCTWCDTAYTWDWAQFDRKAEIVTLDVADVLHRATCQGGGSASGTHNVVITGGEPLLQQSGLAPLATALRAAGLRVEVETNGTIQPAPQLAEHVDQWNVSPKLTTSGNRPELREVPDALSWFAECPVAYFKFVVVEPADVDEVASLASRYGIPNERVLLMPEGTSPETLAARAAWLVPRCQELGYRFGTRLHIVLWGNQRGR
jgi:organic radical activating enzyme